MVAERSQAIAERSLTPDKPSLALAECSQMVSETSATPLEHSQLHHQCMMRK